MTKKQLFTINKITFDSKTRAKEYIQNILRKYPLNTYINSEDFLFILDLLNRHPRQEEKIGVGILSIKIQKDEFGRNKQFLILRKDGSSTDFSYLTCLDGKYKNSLGLFKESARNAVKNQIIEYRNSYFTTNQNKEGKILCKETNKRISIKECHVDHHPRSFDSIIDDFIKLKNIDVDTVKHAGFKDNEQRKSFLDEVMEVLFSEFHKNTAELRVISKVANLTKKKKVQM